MCLLGADCVMIMLTVEYLDWSAGLLMAVHLLIHLINTGECVLSVSIISKATSVGRYLTFSSRSDVLC